MSDPHLPPGCTARDIDGPKCPQCGVAGGCDCEEEEYYDPRTRRERIEDEKADMDTDR